MKDKVKDLKDTFDGLDVASSVANKKKAPHLGDVEYPDNPHYPEPKANEEIVSCENSPVLDLSINEKQVYQLAKELIGREVWLLRQRRCEQTKITGVKIIIDKDGFYFGYRLEGKRNLVGIHDIALTDEEARDKLFNKLKKD